MEQKSDLRGERFPSCDGGAQRDGDAGMFPSDMPSVMAFPQDHGAPHDQMAWKQGSGMFSRLRAFLPGTDHSNEQKLLENDKTD